MRPDCNNCGMLARPYDAKCRLCGATVQDDSSARAKYDEWMAAPAAVIKELEQNSDRLELTYREYLAWLKKSRIIHIAIGAIVFPALMIVSLLPNSLPAICLDVAAGGILAWDLNRRRGGRFRGIGCYAGAGFASTILKIVTGPGLEAYFRALGADMATALVGMTFWSGSFLLVLVFGAMFGNKIEFDYDMSV